MNYNRAVMKQDVKQSMRQTKPHPMLATLLYQVLATLLCLAIVGAGVWLIVWLITGLFSGSGLSSENMEELFIGMMVYGPEYLDGILSPEVLVSMMMQITLLISAVSLVAGILTTIWNGLMNAGYAGYCLDMSRNANPGLGRIFSGFPRAGTVIPAYILVAVFSFLWCMLFLVAFGVLGGILGVIASSLPDLLPLFISLLAVAEIGCMIGIIFVILRYAMVPYVIADSKGPLSAMDAIRDSKALMKGRTGSFFVLQLSFIGWYLLESLVVMVCEVIATVVVYITADQIEEMLSYDYDTLLRLIFSGYYADTFSQLLFILLPIALLCGAAIFVINLWLTPYRTGSNASFYVYARSGQPDSGVRPIVFDGQPAPYSGQPGPYGGQPVAYDEQPAPYGSQPPYGGQSVPYGSQPPYGGQPVPYGSQPPYGGQPVPYDSQPGPYGGQPGPYGGQPGPYDSQPAPYGGQPGPYDSQPAPYGGQPGPYSSGPYGYTPPNQRSFGGYDQGPQPPQSGTGTYPQWDAPQAPQAPFPVTEPLTEPTAPESPVPEAPVISADPPVPETPVAPAAPVIPEAPVVPAAPVIPEAPVIPAAPVVPETPEFPKTTMFPEAPAVPEPFVPTRLAEPVDDLPFEEPYTGPEPPNDGTIPPPNGPVYPNN